MEFLPVMKREDFQNDSEYISYCKKRYRQKTNYEYRQREKLKILKASSPLLGKISTN